MPRKRKILGAELSKVELDESHIFSSGKWQPDFTVFGFRLALLGLGNSRIAEAMGVKEETFNKWLRYKPELRNAIDKGRQRASARVVDALYQRAIGYSHPDQVILSNRVKEYDPNTGKLIREYNKPLVIDTIKYYPPDFSSIQKFLNTKEREIWNDKTYLEIQQNITIENKIPLKDLSDEELRLMESIGIKKNENLRKAAAKELESHNEE